jgi:hypothetical protein
MIISRVEHVKLNPNGRLRKSKFAFPARRVSVARLTRRSRHMHKFTKIDRDLELDL